ncbi:MAG TPA: hypothetical protein VGM67_04905 [Gemmatimonadaceae bacterium]|jgi:hypothetical protein
MQPKRATLANLSFALVAATVTALTALGCASHSARPSDVDPAVLARLNATLQLVGRETTWVTRGSGYELIARTKTDLAAVQPTVDGEAAAFHKVFPKDSLALAVATIRRMVPPGKLDLGPAAVPNDIRGEVVQIALPAFNAKPVDDKTGLASVPGGEAALNAYRRTLPIVRVWLAAHATSLTKTAGSPLEMGGETLDHRLSAWAEAMIPLLADDSLADRFITALAPHQENLHPLSSYFSMERPGNFTLASGRGGAQPDEGGRRGEGGGGGAGGGIGGIGGRGGMGRGGMGGGMGGGRGGSRGGARGGDRGSSDDSKYPPLRSDALFDAQSLVLGKFLVMRNGYDYIGALADARIMGKVTDSTVVAREKLSLEQLEVEWRRWLGLRAAEIAGPAQ